MPKPVEPNLNQGKASRLRLYLSLAIIAIWIIIGFFVFQDIGELIQGLMVWEHLGQSFTVC